MFAKIYETEVGQILVKRDDCDNGPEVRIYFEPEGLGVCSIAFNWKNSDSDKQWRNAESVFEKMTIEECVEAVKRVLYELTEEHQNENS